MTDVRPDERPRMTPRNAAALVGALSRPRRRALTTGGDIAHAGFNPVDPEQRPSAVLESQAPGNIGLRNAAIGGCPGPARLSLAQPSLIRYFHINRKALANDDERTGSENSSGVTQ